VRKRNTSTANPITSIRSAARWACTHPPTRPVRSPAFAPPRRSQATAATSRPGYARQWSTGRRGRAESDQADHERRPQPVAQEPGHDFVGGPGGRRRPAGHAAGRY
jgi:hypothetical protein